MKSQVAKYLLKAFSITLFFEKFRSNSSDISKSSTRKLFSVANNLLEKIKHGINIKMNIIIKYLEDINLLIQDS